MVRRGVLGLALGLVAGAAGCISHADAVIERFQRQYHCRSVRIEELNDTSFRARGCGVEAVYTCATGYRPGFGGPRPEEVCVEESTSRGAVAASGPPAVQRQPGYPWPPRQGALEQRFDEFERTTIIRASMTVGPYVFAVRAAPGLRADLLRAEILVPGGGPQVEQCHELALIIASEVARFGPGLHTRGAAGEALTSFDLPAARLDPGLASGVLKARFCGLDWQFTPEQVLALRSFRARFGELAVQNAAPPPAPPEAPPVSPAPQQPAP